MTSPEGRYESELQNLTVALSKSDESYPWRQHFPKIKEGIVRWADWEAQQRFEASRPRRWSPLRALRAACRTISVCVMPMLGAAIFALGVHVSHKSFGQAFSTTGHLPALATVCLAAGAFLLIAGSIYAALFAAARSDLRAHSRPRPAPRKPSAPAPIRYEVSASTDNDGIVCACVERHAPEANSSSHTATDRFEVTLGSRSSDTALITDRFNAVVAATAAAQARAAKLRDDALERLGVTEAAISAALIDRTDDTLANLIAGSLTSHLTTLAPEQLKAASDLLLEA